VPGKIRVSSVACGSESVRRFSDEDVAEVQEQSFDVLINCGSGILSGAILSSARLGIISFYHSGNRIDCSGIAGFWEVYYREDRTGFMVQRLTEGPDGGDVILRGYIPTQDTHLLNAAMLLTKSYFHLRTLLLWVARTGQLPPAEPPYPNSDRLLVSPGARELVVYLSKQVARSVSERVRRALRYRERWGICFAKTDWRHVVMGRGTRVETPPGRFLADPFVVTRDGRTCVFAEEFVFESSKGHIAAFELSDGGARRLGIALEESFHLSFPYLFEFDGTLFMCPETRAAKEIRIYKCTEFPLKWQFAGIAMNNVVAADTLIFLKHGLWWLLTGISWIPPHDCSELHLFWARTPLDGHWVPHTRNPILIDPQKARNGGLLRTGEDLIRVAQNLQFGSYGASTRLFRITRLTPDDYAEELVGRVTADFMPGIHGTHHFHSNGTYTVWDFKKWERV
jgi:hypothetical protein